MKETLEKYRMATLVFLGVVVVLWTFLFFAVRVQDSAPHSSGVADMDKGKVGQGVDERENPEEAKLLDAQLSLEEKVSAEVKRREKYLEEETLLSAESLLKALEDKGAVVDEDLKSRLVSGDISPADVELIQLHIATLLTDEESFYVELSQYTNFNEMYEAFKRREETTGLFYGTKMLAEPATYKEASLEQVKSILDKGAVLPDDVVMHLIKADNLELAEGLVKLGYDINLDFQDRFSSMNGIEILARNYTYNPLGADPTGKANDIRRLSDMGVPLDVADGTRDVLDIVLEAAVNNRYEPSARRLTSLAHSLIDMGVELNTSHFQLLDKLKSERPSIYLETRVQ